MEILQILWIFYVILVAITFAFVSYMAVKSKLNYQYSVPVLVAAIVILSVFWPGTWLAILCTRGKKDHKESDEDGDY